MRTALLLLAEFILFGLGVISCLLLCAAVANLGGIGKAQSFIHAAVMLALPVVLLGMTFGFFTASGAVDRRRKGRHVVRRTAGEEERPR